MEIIKSYVGDKKINFERYTYMILNTKVTILLRNVRQKI